MDHKLFLINCLDKMFNSNYRIKDNDHLEGKLMNIVMAPLLIGQINNWKIFNMILY